MMDISRYSSVFILTDSRVAPLWLDETLRCLGCPDAKEIVIEAGEAQKKLSTVERIWEALLEGHADRHSLLVNLGGGVVTDLGGFAASCFKRGIDFVNVPTTLLAMVDAAIGGKTGVDFCGFKNQIGTFAFPKDVVLCPKFLSTLPLREKRSGLAEMIKCGFIADMTLLQVDLEHCQDHIQRAADIKKAIVDKDPCEVGSRKMLNFGHTIGHAIESHFAHASQPLSHGEAVAMGMYAALWISVRQCGLDAEALRKYESKLPMLLKEAPASLADKDVEPVLMRLAHDKKNHAGQPRFVLLQALEKPVWDVGVSPEMVCQSMRQLVLALNRVVK